jgi:hypothetical protein
LALKVRLKHRMALKPFRKLAHPLPMEVVLHGRFLKPNTGNSDV